MIKTEKTLKAQLIVRGIMFLLFFIAIFTVVPGLRYLFLLFIIANLVLGYTNERKDVLGNVTFILLAPLLFIPVLEYLITAMLVVFTGIHLLRYYLWYRKGGKKDIKKKNVNNRS